MHVIEPKDRDEWLALRKPYLPGGIQGLGSSEIAIPTGHNHYKTALELWQEKTGLKEPQGDTPDMARGRANEDMIRARFALQEKDWCRVEYHDVRMYISDDLPLYTTLDGEIIVLKDHDFTCRDIKLGGMTVMHLKAGMHGILEIKDTAPKSESFYLEWMAFPEMYRMQNAGQLRVTGYDFVIDLAHITGDYAVKGEEYRTYGGFEEDLKPEIEEIEYTIPAFWHYIAEKKQPPLSLFDEDSLTLVEIKPELEIGSIWADLEAAKLNVIRYAHQFEGMTFGEHELKEAKTVRAELNRYKKAINDLRISIGKQWDAPLVEFKGKMDELISIVDEVCVPIDKQIKGAEEALDKAKLEKVRAMIADKLASYTEHPETVDAITAMGGVPENPRWLNSTMRMPAIEKEVEAYLETVTSDLASISAVSDDEQMHQSILQEYFRTRNLNDALQAKERILEARQAALDAEAKKREQLENARRRQEEWQKKKAAVEASKTATTAAEKPAEEKKPITITIRFSHTEREAFKGLLAYMKDHGFTYEMVR